MTKNSRFKAINDTYGHKVSDKALIELSEILKAVIKASGEIVRYAGNEFIIILSTQDDEKVKSTISNIHKLLYDINKADNGNLYELSVSLRHCKLDFSKSTLDELFGKIDKLMYGDKREYYKIHEKRPHRDIAKQ